ncbi:hypothetical protein KCTC52924_00190 [Arenibacter antarcticus]|uniref:WG repeat-containing protein n=1 Tax=Arenibacter antarcticus TaxID=2040469 RepID=A0ABW5VL84_9FLAO|nr:WG repeat-containing protein [Arenibacter sp. H213]MCM4169045.1 hypothetical protein [Arenibacter sp. H213]
MKTKITSAMVLLCMFGSIYAQQYALVRENNLFGYINKAGEYAISPQFKKADNFTNERAAANNGDKWGYINPKGEWAIQPQYDNVKEFNSGLALVSADKQWHYINTAGEVVATPTSDKYYDFNYGVAFYKNNDKIGLLGTDGKLVIEPTYDEIKGFVDGYAKARQGDLWGMVDTKGAIYIPIENEEVGDYNRKGVWVKKEGTFGIITNGTFNPVENAERIWDFTDKSDLTYARSNKLMGFINNQGEWVIPPKFDKARDFSQGLAPVFMNKNWGFINEKGEQIIDFKFKDAEVFGANGLAPAKDKKWGFIDKTGKWAIQPDYDITAGLSFDMFKKNVEKGFIDGLARVKHKKGWGFLNKKGEVLGDKWYQNAELFDDVKE